MPSRLRALPVWFFPFLTNETEIFARRFKFTFWVSIALGAAALAFMCGMSLSGDETTYERMATAIGNAVRGLVTFDYAGRFLVGYGWFMPGMPVLLSPLYAVWPDPPLIAIRLLATTLTLVLWVWMLRAAYRHFGGVYALALLVFPSLSLTWQFFTTTVWGDVAGGMLMLIALARTFSMSRAIVRGERPSWRSIGELALIMALMIYFRGSLLLVAGAVCIFLVAISVFVGAWSSAGRSAVAALGVAILLAPWSLQASQTLGGRVITTSTVNLSMAITFGDPNKLCFGPCAKGNVWYTAAIFSRAQAKQRGVSQLAVQKQMRDVALEGLTLEAYLSQVSANFRTFLFAPSGFHNRFISRNNLVPEPSISTVRAVFAGLSNPLYFSFLTFLALANLVVIRRDVDGQLLSLLIKLGTVCVMVQPFLHPSHPRYWVTFAPLMGIAAAFVWMLAMSRRRASALRAVGVNTAQGAPSSEQGDRDSIEPRLPILLFIIQLGYVAAFLGMTCTLLVFALI